MTVTVECPKCAFVQNEPFSECPRCGIIVAKFLKREVEKQARADKIDEGHELAGLKESKKLIIRQYMEKMEVWLGVETRNHYTINGTLFEAAEIRTSLGAILSRLFVGNWRPFEMEIRNRGGSVALTLERPFRFFFHTLEVFHASGELLGTVRRRFGILRRHYAIHDAFDREVFSLLGPILHPWTFNIIRNGQQDGQITKKWSGLLKETFSKADDFGVVFPQRATLTEKALLTGAVFLIDFVHFEKPNR